MPEPIAAVIARALEDDSGAVEREVFGTADAAEIAAILDRFCRAELGGAAKGALFYRASIGCVLGLELVDGRRVVLKTHQTDKSAARLAACQAVQAGLHARGYPCPEPLLGPRPLGRGLCIVERHLARGAPGDPHDPAVRDEIARSLFELGEIARRAGLGRDLSGSWYGTLPAAQLWPRPHTPRFDFSATASGAEWIDALARRARAVPLAGEHVLSHFDFRAEHVRFEAGRISAVYDWDSLHFEREPIAAGVTAAVFTADFARQDAPAAPSLAEIEGFLSSYERARGRRFDPGELATALGACLYIVAYMARCEHAAAGRPGQPPPAFTELLRAAGPSLVQRL